MLPKPSEQNESVLTALENFFEDFFESQIRKIEHSANASIYTPNPALLWFLAKTIDGEVTPTSIAKALILPRQLGTSPATSFGTRIQSFISDTLVNAYGSAASGMDIEFEDQIDGKMKYLQLKAGPLTINKGDVAPMDGEFKKVKQLLRANGRALSDDHFAIGVMYGEERDLNAFYVQLRDVHGWELYVGKDFWWRLTGDENFMDRLLLVVRTATEKVNSSDALNAAIDTLSKDVRIINLAMDYHGST